MNLKVKLAFSFLFNQEDKALPVPSPKFNINTENNHDLDMDFCLKLHPKTDSTKGYCKHISFQENTGVHWGSFLSLSRFLVSSYKSMHYSPKNTFENTARDHD